jgi:hypothetical protein
VDVETRATTRDVVDGQQRLRAIIDFASSKFRLSNKSERFNGLSFNDLDEDSRRSFLSYPISTVQLIDVDIDDILEIFARLNSYSVKVTPAELRHSKYSDPIKWSIWNFAREHNWMWSERRLVSLRDAVRMKHNSYVAELYMSVDQGLSDGGEPQIDKYYKAKKSEDDEYFHNIYENAHHIVQFIEDAFGDDFSETTFFTGPNFLILFNFVGFLRGICPVNANTQQWAALHRSGVDIARLTRSLTVLSTAVDEDDIEGRFGPFVVASKTTTQRRSSRAKRFGSLAESYA